MYVYKIYLYINIMTIHHNPLLELKKNKRFQGFRLNHHYVDYDEINIIKEKEK